LVLGCTHYPYLEKVIARELGANVTLVNSAKAVAAQLKDLLERTGIAGKKKGGKTVYYTSDSAEKFAGLAELFLGGLDGPVLRVDPEEFMGKQ
ncbi:MAG: glutamate racemase, partial [Clostridia bacterium]|nr:glutamate racemase [Clostridia bacterium]